MNLLLRLRTVATLLLLLSQAAPASTGHVLHEKRSALHASWKRHAPAPANSVLPMRIGLKQRNLEDIDRHIQDVADPFSPNFGKHWTAKQVADFFVPAQETSDATIAWLVESGISRERLRYSKGKDWIELNATVKEAEALLDTQYHIYKHDAGDFRLACDSYGLPHHIKQHVDFVLPTIALDGMRAAKEARPALITEPEARITSLDSASNSSDLSHCNTIISVECLRALYGFPAGKYAHSGNQLGIAEWADYLYLPDLPIFFKNWTNPQIPSDVVPEFISIDGGKVSNLSVAQDGEVVESALDFQISYAIIYPQNTRLYQNGDGVNIDSVGTFNIFLDALDGSYCTYEGGDAPYVDPQYPDPNIGGYVGPEQCGGAPLSNVISVSYNQIEAALPVFYQQRQCYEWGKLALQGVSVIYASGDSGVANRYNSGYNNSCLNEEYGYVETNGTKFSPSFPVNCPYITAVGATMLNGSVEGGEIAAAGLNKNPLLDYYSGGGFSNIFETPSWQKDAVRGYLRNHDPGYKSPEIYNRSGRAYPDVAAMGLNVTTVWLNKTLGIGGTSASAPIFASIVTLLNEERLQAGKKPIGFLNPVLYAHPDMFNDITSGSNPGCGTDGFKAAPGWDPVTGLGTPNYEKMKQVFLSLP
ncbi:subtilisin-like protein [Diplogelasinospora grovesii]|uniref:tripeptidyl-peptidase II n=1 Tax=Diplogelasinospora grovesii TaxID=303347 RepID=A0AAN6MZR3_9PEZI|nr:subtilisin-like protein [Diplogelasinospora grovesii]